MVVRKIDQENDGRLNHGFFKVVMHIACSRLLAAAMTSTLLELIGSVNKSIEKALLRRQDRIRRSDVSILYGSPSKSFLIQKTPQWLRQQLGREDLQSWYVPANPINEFNPPTSESTAS